jgi:esterase
LLYSQSRGQGSPVVLLHGLFGMGDNLGLLARALSGHFQVFSLDLPNHGRSPRTGSMSLDDMAVNVLEFLESEGISRADFVGHSLGGKLAMQLALNHPARVRRLVVADIAPVEYSGNHDDVFAALRAVAIDSVQSRAEVATVLSQHLSEEGVSQFLLKSLYRNEQGGFSWRMDIDALYNCYPQLCMGYNGSGVFTGPTLFIKGENSSYIQTKHQSTIETLFPQYQFKMIQNTGHWLHAEKPVVFNRLVERFLLES